MTTTPAPVLADSVAEAGIESNGAANEFAAEYGGAAKPGMPALRRCTPITLVMGFVGAGKTTIILDTIRRMELHAKKNGLPAPNLCLLKNEFGDLAVDSLLAKTTSAQVTEITNGCLCCVLVGRLSDALLELRDKYNPDRIFVECSGSALPATLVWRIQELGDSFSLDAVITVVDCENFCGYEDTSPTARMQAQYTDLILLNKWQDVDERKMDRVLDHVLDLNIDTPRVKYTNETPLELLVDSENGHATKSRNFSSRLRHDFSAVSVARNSNHEHMSREFEILTVKGTTSKTMLPTLDCLKSLLQSLPKNQVYRVKGVIMLQVPDENRARWYVVNHAFGRTSILPLVRQSDQNNTNDASDEDACPISSSSNNLASNLTCALTVMGKDLCDQKESFAQKLNLGDPAQQDTFSWRPPAH